MAWAKEVFEVKKQTKKRERHAGFPLVFLNLEGKGGGRRRKEK